MKLPEYVMQLQTENPKLHVLVVTFKHVDIPCSFTLKIGPSSSPSRTSDKYKHSTEGSKILGKRTQL